jgi:hypothetical protein
MNDKNLFAPHLLQGPRIPVLPWVHNGGEIIKKNIVQATVRQENASETLFGVPFVCLSDHIAILWLER